MTMKDVYYIVRKVTHHYYLKDQFKSDADILEEFNKNISNIVNCVEPDDVINEIQIIKCVENDTDKGIVTKSDIIMCEFI